MWSNVIGQARVKDILQAAIRNEKLAGAYLFHGPEGTGKDAAAIELAKTLNCLNLKNGEACDECINCVQVESLSSPLLSFVYATAKEKESDRDAPPEATP